MEELDLNNLTTDEYERGGAIRAIIAEEKAREREYISPEGAAKAEAFYELPKNYVNKYNLARGDFPPYEPQAALDYCRKKLGRVDVEYIASLCLCSPKDAIFALKGKIYRDPSLGYSEFYKGYVTADEYLSGDLYGKYLTASDANVVWGGAYAENVRALISAMPPEPERSKVWFGLGSTWIPPEYVADFVQYLFRISLVRNKRICEVFYERSISRYIIILNVDVRSTVLASKTYGTERMDMFKILDKALNHDQIHITDLLEEDGRIVRRVNREQTMLAEERRSRLKTAFNKWVSELPEDRRTPLYEIFYKRFGCVRPRHYDGSYLDFSDIGGGVTLYGYQKNAVARIIESKNTLLAHDVGAGKTFVMIAAGHVMRETGVSTKNMYVVPNSIAAQWRNDYYTLYPNAKVLAVSPEDFTPSRRVATMALMCEDWEAIIIPYSTFELIPADYGGELERLRDKISAIESAITDSARRRQKARARLTVLLSKEEEKVKKVVEEYRKKISEQEGKLTFKDLGVNTLFVDEAHNYKNLPLDSDLGPLKGLNTDGSEKCDDVFIKTRTVLRQNGGRGVVFATGTPVTNSVADVFVMQKFLSEELLRAADVDSFDNWAGTFGEIVRDYEIDVDTESYRLTTRFNSFNNLEQLSKWLNVITDFHVCEREGLPMLDCIETVLVPKSKLQREMLDVISERVERIRGGQVDRKTDNLLKVTTDGRKLALDTRLVSEDFGGLGFELKDKIASENSGEEEKNFNGGKITACAEKVLQVAEKYAGCTQLVFCDIGTPKTQFNVYDELKKVLTELGMPPAEIAFIHDATTDRQREKIFESVNNGVIRVLIGSTFKLGTGVNVQRRLIALHHLDVPWRPSDMVQREGRLIRQGNLNEKVYIFRYVTEGSFDAYSWQLLENKQRFISELMGGAARDADERQLADSVLSYAEVKALAIGNPLVKERVETFNELMRYKTLMREDFEKRGALEDMQVRLPVEIAGLKTRLALIKDDVKNVEKNYETPVSGLIAPLIQKSIAEHSLENTENFICDYSCFKLYLPSGFNRLHPYLVLVGNARYMVDVVTFGTGACQKLDNFIGSLKNYAKGVADNLASLEMQLKQAQVESRAKTGYEEQVKELSAKLADIDKRLGL